MDLTKITATRPDRLSKGFRISADGRLEKMPGGQLLDGTATRVNVSSVTELAVLLSGLSPANALTYGVSEQPKARVVSRSILAQIDQNGGPPVIARTREFFAFPKGPAVLMFDYDPQDGQPSLTSEQLRALIYSVAPAIEHAPHLLAPSASTYIYNSNTCLKGPSGLRMLIPVTEGTDIPRAGETLFKRLWLAGHGYIAISTAGSLLVRGPLDASVWQPERLDFCGGACCEPPLEQRRPGPVVFNPDSSPLDTREQVKALSLAKEAELKELINRAKKAAQSSADEIRQTWIETRVSEHMNANPKADATKIRETYSQAVNGEQLLSDFVLYPSEGERVTVGKILENPDKWHGLSFADPLEPEYRNDRRIAFLNLRAAGRPYLFSNAHGGRKFYLLKQRAKIRLIPGQRVHATENAIDVLVKGGQHYDRGGEIVVVTNDGQVIPRDEKGLLYDLDKAILFEKFDGRRNDFSVCDCKPTIATGIMAARGNWGMPFLLGVSTAPTMDPRTGRIIEMDGYDVETGLMLCLKDPSLWPGVPDHPTIEQVKNAVQVIWSPFRDFPFEGPISRGVVINAILTAAIRPLLPKAPAFAFDAPTPGSGKTLIATCLSEIAGEIPTVIPDTQDNEEIKKRILAILRAGKRVAILDNLTGTVTSPALCGLLTSERYEDRVLGQTEMLSVPTACLIILTGNNLTLRGDLCRRVLKARIDPKVEEPWKRRFEVDPAFWCKMHRMDIIAAALTILRATMREQGHLADRTASFEVWSDTARRAVVFINDHDLMDVSDPVRAIDTAFSLDPETSKLAALLSACATAFKGQPFRTAELIAKATDAYDVGKGFTYTNLELNDAVNEIAGEGRTINARRLGRWIEKNRGRIVDGMKIEAVASRQGVKIWQVRS